MNVGGPTSELEIREEAADEGIAGEVPEIRPGPLLEVAEAEMEEAVGEHVHPLLLLAPAFGMDVDHTRREHHRPAVRVAGVSILTAIDRHPLKERAEQGMMVQRALARPEGGRGRVDRLGATPGHWRASRPAGADRARPRPAARRGDCGSRPSRPPPRAGRSPG